MKARSFLLGFGSCLLMILGCATAGISYRYYGISGVSFDQGKLLGPSEIDDIPLSKCAPSGESKTPCVVMFSDEFLAFKKDYLDLKQQLIDCQKR